MIRPPPRSPLFPYTPLSRSQRGGGRAEGLLDPAPPLQGRGEKRAGEDDRGERDEDGEPAQAWHRLRVDLAMAGLVDDAEAAGPGPARRGGRGAHRRRPRPCPRPPEDTV